MQFEDNEVSQGMKYDKVSLGFMNMQCMERKGVDKISWCVLLQAW